jgi:1-acyl-sn-glycerol-3-phosphate acyltransferase
VLARFSRWLLRRLGWSLNIDLPAIDKYVAIAAPHTSNWDFLLGILAAWAIPLKVSWLGKHSLFRWPYGWYFRAIGGVPVRRDGSKQYIQQMTDLFNQSEHLILALAPEGTRSRTDHWKTGFHTIARAANVPILMAYFDYPNKQVGIGGMFYPSDDIEADFRLIREFYKDRRGKNPDKESLIQARNRKKSEG